MKHFDQIIAYKHVLRSNGKENNFVSSQIKTLWTQWTKNNMKPELSEFQIQSSSQFNDRNDYSSSMFSVVRA